MPWILPKPSLMERIFDFIADKNYVYDRGLDALKRGDISGSIKNFSRVIRLDPKDASAHCMLAGCLICAEEYPAALKYFAEYVQLKPGGASQAELDYLNVVREVASMNRIEASEHIRHYVKKVNESDFPFWSG